MASGFGAQLVSALAFNVFLRLFTFFLSTWLTRALLPAQVGINFSYLVYVESIHFLSREAIKNVAARYSILSSKTEREEESAPQKTTCHTGHQSSSVKIHRRKLMAMLNTSALTIPMCVLVMIVVEVLGAGILPGVVALWNALFSSGTIFTAAIDNNAEIVGANAIPNSTIGLRSRRMAGASGSGADAMVLLPSLSGPLLHAWGAAWQLAAVSSPATPHALWSSWWWLFCTAARLAIPEVLVWTSVVGLALVDPSVALLTSLDWFRTIVVGEGTTMMVRLGCTLFLTKSLLVSSASPEADHTIPSGLHRFVMRAAAVPYLPPAGVEDLHYREAYHGMERVNKEWLVRLVFATGCIVHSVAMIAFYAIACGSSLTNIRWWLGTHHWCAPEPLLGRLHTSVFVEALPNEREASDRKEGSEEDVEKTEAEEIDTTNGCRTSTVVGQTRWREKRVESKPALVLRLIFPLLTPYVRWSVMRGALHHHRLLLTAFFRESLIRLALSEGTNIALLSVSDAASRGCYQTISRLGALATRLLFRIWENACQAHWSRLAHQGEAKEAVQGLSTMLRLSLYVGFVCSWLGPLYARLVLTVLYSGRWTTVGMVGSLQYYCHTMGPMAWNGLLECFVRAVAHPSLLKQQQLWTVVISVLYVVSSYGVLLHLRRKQDLALEMEWAQMVQRDAAQNSTLSLPGEAAVTFKSTQAIERCEDTTVTDALLVLHRFNMIVRILISIGLLLWCKNTAPAASSSSPPGDSAVSFSREKQELEEEVTGVIPEGMVPPPHPTAEEVQPIPSAPVLSWRDLLTIFPLTTSPALVALFLWTRTPSLFPDYLLQKLYMPPLLSLLFMAVVFFLDTTMRGALLDMLGKYRGRRSGKK